MAIKVSSKVWKYYPNGGPELLLLLALADWADENGCCYPSIETIAKKLRLSDSQARRTIHVLIDTGYVDVIGNENGGPPGSTRIYQINLSKLTPSINASHTTGIEARGTPSIDAVNGSHQCKKTASVDASQYVINTLKKPSQENKNACCRGSDLIFSKKLNERQIEEIKSLLEKIDLELAQQILDELAAGLESVKNTIHNPIGYVRSLVKKSKSGEFRPEKGLAIAERRRLHSENNDKVIKIQERARLQPPFKVTDRLKEIKGVTK